MPGVAGAVLRQRATDGGSHLRPADAFDGFWLTDYEPSLRTLALRRFPRISHICDTPDGLHQVEVVPSPSDCTDDFVQAYYSRPEMVLRPEAAPPSPPGPTPTPARSAKGSLASSGTWPRPLGTTRTVTFAASATTSGRYV